VLYPAVVLLSCSQTGAQLNLSKVRLGNLYTLFFSRGLVEAGIAAASRVHRLNRRRHVS
jgi:hypothetical protein